MHGIYRNLSLTVVHFDKFSGSSPTMAEEDFAGIMLRHTTWDLDPVFKRLRTRSPSRVSVSTVSVLAHVCSVGTCV